MTPNECPGPISILKRLFAIAEIPIVGDFQVSDSERVISLIDSNWEHILAFLRSYTHEMALQMIQKRADGKSVTLLISSDIKVTWKTP